MDGFELAADWRRSTHCESGTCVEVARSDIEYAVRDSTDPDGPILRFSITEWSEFVRAARAGEFNG